MQDSFSWIKVCITETVVIKMVVFMMFFRINWPCKKKRLFESIDQFLWRMVLCLKTLPGKIVTTEIYKNMQNQNAFAGTRHQHRLLLSLGGRHRSWSLPQHGLARTFAWGKHFVSKMKIEKKKTIKMKEWKRMWKEEQRRRDSLFLRTQHQHILWRPSHPPGQWNAWGIQAMQKGSWRRSFGYQKHKRIAQAKSTREDALGLMHGQYLPKDHRTHSSGHGPQKLGHP